VGTVLELYQAEWCPHSRKVRQRLTEVGVDFVARQIEPEPEDRTAIRIAVGDSEIPVLVRDDGPPLQGEDEILSWVDATHAADVDAAQHRAKAMDNAGLPS
jgi:glutaredoxin